MTSSELDSRNIAISMKKSVENLVISSQDAIGQSISQALTFSGVITHHTNQILQENRSVSRSPSPSPRIQNPTDSASEALENDKNSEYNLALGSNIAADNASISSSELATPSKPEKGSNKSQEAIPGSIRAKKKSWYNSLYPTYKSKSDDFRRLFQNLPDDERLIVDYSCALQKDILAHGRLYASQNYLCFYANIFGWETTLMHRWKDVTAITKEKTALVIPNAILVCTDSEKNFFTSFSGRDKAYLMLFRIWQNALMDQQMNSQEVWQWVHSCYGEELGFNSDDDEYSKDFLEEAVSLPLEAAIEEQELADASCMDAGGGDVRRGTRSSSQGRDSSPPLGALPPVVDGIEMAIPAEAKNVDFFELVTPVVDGIEMAIPAEAKALTLNNGDDRFREEEGADTLPTDMSDTSDSEPDDKHTGGTVEKCPNTHEGKLILRQHFAFNIDQLFTMIFTNSRFNLELLAARNITDYVQSPWQAQNGLKCRQINYTIGLTSGPIGPKEVHVTETQVMNKCSKPGQQYSIDCSSDNAGIPYADYFSVAVHYCLSRAGDGTHLELYGHVKYKKSMWPMVKTFLEKNTVSGIEEFSRLLESRLNTEAETAVPHTVRKSRRHRRLTTSSGETAAPATKSISPLTRAPVPRPRVPPTAPSPGTMRWLVGAVLLLLAINALLYWRLYHAEGPQPVQMQDLQDRLSSANSAQSAEWARLLEQHGRAQRQQLHAWRHALHSATTHLAQTEQALTKLLETIKPTLEKAQRDADRNEL